MVRVPRSDRGPSLVALVDRGPRVELLDVDRRGVLDPDALAARLRRDRPAPLHLTAALSHRAVLQPVAECSALCAGREVPVVLDVARALGRFPLPPGAAACCGPRGVGFLAVAEPWQGGSSAWAPALPGHAWPGEPGPVRRLGSREAFVAGRVGRAAREVLGGVPGWSRCDSVDAPGAVLSLRPASDAVDVAAVRAGLLRRGVVCPVAGPERAPHRVTRPLLRFSPHVDTTAEVLDRLARVLAEATSTSR
ncbi:aminotransferase class V-fold PLP-dependent enzyme [Saccharothrix syringae]|uniref:Aminotransferase class V-fold PLP-dependent enzyme n=1 Tax=Saccharothrix syringae TaxID=103733 RepID=A0A5Q0H4F0_SACSY|nr:hypothetical protein [Saccharothrix syringae]QFZ20794.1 hypothetical protein EKG83_28410 [Saccharothrix syringae]